MNKFRSAILSGKGLHSGNPLVSEKESHGAKPDDMGSVEITRQEGRHADHRDEDRHRLEAEQAQAVYKSSDYAVELVNLSGGGAMIAAPFEPYLWERVDLKLGEGQSIECAVRWVRNGRVGLEFAHETGLDCAPEVRDALLLEVIRRSFPEVEMHSIEPEAPLTAGADSGSEPRRVARRHPLIWSGQLHYNHDSHAVRLRNIGATGALIEGCRALAVGGSPMLDLGNGVELFGTIAWVRGEQAGMRFDREFDLSMLAETQPEVTPQHWVRPTFLDHRADEPNPWDDGWNRRSLAELQRDLDGFLKR